MIARVDYLLLMIVNLVIPVFHKTTSRTEVLPTGHFSVSVM